MRVVAITDIRLFGHREFAFAMINVSGRSAFSVAAELAELPEAISATICTGRFDVIVPVLGRVTCTSLTYSALHSQRSRG